MTQLQKLPAVEIIYPESDGQPLADNNEQLMWIMTIAGGLKSLYINEPDVAVEGDLLWYPVEGDSITRAAPDVMVIFGRPKMRRGSYQQWLEDDIPPQVAFEIISPNNFGPEMARKFRFYQKHGVQEYYTYDPQKGVLKGWLRQNEKLLPIVSMQGWVSPHLKVRFELAGKELKMYRPDNEPFLTFEETYQKKRQAEREAEQAKLEVERERDALAALRAKLRAKGIDPDDL